MRRRSGAKSKLMKTQTFAVVGLGLLGGSLGAALRQAFPKSKILGYSRSASKVKLAQKKGLIHQGSTQLNKIVPSADVIIICTPVDTISEFAKQIDIHAKPGTIVTDVGSTKNDIVKWAAKQSFRNISFVGSHPMAGSHLTGLEHAKKDLYNRAVVFVTRHSGISQRALKVVKSIWFRLRCQVVEIDSKRHDEVVAQISQFPHLLSALLVDLASDRALKFASTGFRDTTRIAQGDPRLWAPIFLTNRSAINQLIIRSEKQLNHLKTALSRRDINFLLKFLKNSANRRQKINQK